MTFEKQAKVKNQIPKQKVLLNASLVLKNFLKQKPNPQQNKHRKKKKKETNREKTLCWKEEKGLEVDHIIKIDREIPFIEHIY
ncbi:hypothetical protein ACLGB1_00875 [Helicobacter pylori]